jgi:adenosylcobinamide amidohydrolase
MNWETLRSAPTFHLRRASRYIVVDLKGPHLVLSSSAENGGQRSDLRHIANHQSCEGAGHLDRHAVITGQSSESYHNQVCAEMALNPADVALMGTAANMNYASVVFMQDAGVEVTAVVTAGVQGNACCAGDPAAWREGETGWEKVSGTIITILLVNRPLTASAMARAAMTMTEAKTAALQRLAVRSLYSMDLATGTGTDQFAIAAPAHSPFDARKALSATGPHVKLGELIGCAVRDATLEALRWQNGLEPSYTRGIFTALARFGLKEDTFFADIEPWLSPKDLELMRKNGKSVFYEPLVGAAAHAMATVLDRIRHNSLPATAAAEALRHQAATMAASLSAKPQLWEDFRATLTETDPARLALQAIALGWAAKWTS